MEVSWKKDGKTVKPKKKENRVTVEYSKEEDAYILEIKEATMKDAGEYTVVVESEAGTVSSSAAVTVQEPASLEEPAKKTDEPVVETAPKVKDVKHAEEGVIEAPSEKTTPLPKFDAEPQSAKVSEGETIRLACKISGISHKFL